MLFHDHEGLSGCPDCLESSSPFSTPTGHHLPKPKRHSGKRARIPLSQTTPRGLGHTRPLTQRACITQTPRPQPSSNRHRGASHPSHPPLLTTRPRGQGTCPPRGHPLYSTFGNPRQCHPRRNWVLQGLGLCFSSAAEKGRGSHERVGVFSGSGTFRRPLVGAEGGDVVGELGHRALCARIACGLQSGECSLLDVFTQVPSQIPLPSLQCPMSVPVLRPSGGRWLHSRVYIPVPGKRKSYS